MRPGSLPVAAALVAAAVVGGVVAIVVRGGAPAPAASAPLPVSTAAVVQTDLSTSVLTEGALGFEPSAPVVNLLDGTYTELPQAGATIGFGQVLWRVDNSPVVLMQGSTPAWRAFAPGMTDGPDIGELQSDLIRLGCASGLLSTSNDRFDTATYDAVKRWQAANGMAQTGEIAFGQAVFLPSPIMVGAYAVSLGQPASPGGSPYAVTTISRIVTVPLNPNLPTVSVGQAVSIVLPTNTIVTGKVTAVGPAPPSGNSQPSDSGTGNQSQTASTEATVAPDDPAATGTGADVPVQVSLTVQSVRDVLAAPISALLALAGGGYGVEVVEPSGTHRLVGVTTGVFTGSQVEISGAGIEAGTKVVVAQ